MITEEDEPLEQADPAELIAGEPDELKQLPFEEMPPPSDPKLPPPRSSYNFDTTTED